MLKKFFKGVLFKIASKPGFPSEVVLNKDFNPYNIHFGDKAMLTSPMRIDGGTNIFIGNHSTIGKHAWLSTFESYVNQKFTPKITIGDNVTIGNYVCITAINEITIGSKCLLSEFVYISDHAHGFDPEFEGPLSAQPLNSKGPVRIGEKTFLGYRSCILPGVSIGKHCIVGANSVVTKSFPDYSMVGGVPARLIKKYSGSSKSWVDC